MASKQNNIKNAQKKMWFLNTKCGVIILVHGRSCWKQ